MLTKINPKGTKEKTRKGPRVTTRAVKDAIMPINRTPFTAPIIRWLKKNKKLSQLKVLQDNRNKKKGRLGTKINVWKRITGTEINMETIKLLSGFYYT